MKFKIQNVICNASMKFKTQTLFSTEGNYSKFQLQKFKIIDVILMCLEILLHKHKAVIKVPGIAKQTVNRK